MLVLLSAPRGRVSAARVVAAARQREHAGDLIVPLPARAPAADADALSSDHSAHPPPVKEPQWLIVKGVDGARWQEQAARQ